MRRRGELQAISRSGSAQTERSRQQTSQNPGALLLPSRFMSNSWTCLLEPPNKDGLSGICIDRNSSSGIGRAGVSGPLWSGAPAQPVAPPALRFLHLTERPIPGMIFNTVSHRKDWLAVKHQAELKTIASADSQRCYRAQPLRLLPAMKRERKLQ